jgi:enoyl-CoA hydratase
MNYENILVATENSIATITINPTKPNALNRKTIEELHQALKV